MFGRPHPIIPALQSEVINALDADDNVLIRSLQALQCAHRDVWTRLKALYETNPPPKPHCFQPGDWVLVKRHHRETLELRWKGPYVVILTTPTTLKVDGIAAGHTWV